MEIAFDDGTLLLRDAPNDLPYTKWDDRVDEYRAQAYRYRKLLERTVAWNHDRDTDDGGDRVGDGNGNQATVQRLFTETSVDIKDTACAYPDLIDLADIYATQPTEA